MDDRTDEPAQADGAPEPPQPGARLKAALAWLALFILITLVLCGLENLKEKLL